MTSEFGYDLRGASIVIRYTRAARPAVVVVADRQAEQTDRGGRWSEELPPPVEGWRQLGSVAVPRALMSAPSWLAHRE